MTQFPPKGKLGVTLIELFYASFAIIIILAALFVGPVFKALGMHSSRIIPAGAAINFGRPSAL